MKLNRITRALRAFLVAALPSTAPRRLFGVLVKVGAVSCIADYGPAEIKAELERIRSAATGKTAELSEKQSELQARLLDLEQRGARGGGSGGGGGDFGDGPTLASLVSEDEGFQMLASGRIKSTTVKLTGGNIHGPRAAALTSGPGLTSVDRRLDVVVPALRRLTIRDLLPVLRTEAGSIEYIRETAFASGAAIVSEGSLKPESTATLTPHTAAVVTIATWLSASKQVLSDNGQLGLYLDNRLRHAVRLAEEAQLLNGSGVGNNLLGLSIGATAYAAPFTFATPTKLDVLRLAIDQLENAGYDVTGVVLAPDDLTAIELLKDTTGAYIKSDPSANNIRTVWGRPCVVTPAQITGKFTLGDFVSAAVLYDREDPVLDVGTVGDDFIRNMVRLRLEERVSLAVQLPGAIVAGLFP